MLCLGGAGGCAAISSWAAVQRMGGPEDPRRWLKPPDAPVQPDAVLRVEVGDDHSDGVDGVVIVADGFDAPVTDALTAAGTAVLLHGLYENRRHPDLAQWRAALQDDGWDVVAPDLRGHGESGGATLGWGRIDAQDLAALLDHVEAERGEAERVLVVGFSYGGIAALHWMAGDPRVDAAVTLAAPADPLETLPMFVRRWTGSLSWLTTSQRLSSAFANRLRGTGVDPEALPAETLSGRFDGRPVLLLHGDADRLAPPEHAGRWAGAIGPSATAVLLEGQRHSSIAWFRGEALARARAFWREHAVETPGAGG